MNNYLELLKYVYRNRPMLQSDYARHNAKLIAEACSRGHITSVIEGRSFNAWFITMEGSHFYQEYSGYETAR